MSSNNSILDNPIEEINVPILRPTRYVQRREPPLLIERNYNRFADEMMAYIPRPMRRRVNRRIGRLRREIGNIYQRYYGIRLPHRTEAPLRGYLNTYRIDGQRGYDQTTFIQYARPRMMRLLRGMQRPIKMKLILTCRFQKGDDTTDFHSHANVQEVMQDDNIGDMINTMIEKILANIEKFQGMGSGWQFESVVSLDINVDPFEPLGGAFYFPLPYKLAVKKAIINPKNNDNKCFKWVVTEAAFPRKKNRQRIDDKLINNATKLNWEGVVFPTPLGQIYRFEKQNLYSINVYGWDGKRVYPLRISKVHENGRQCINLLLLSNKESQHYCLINKMSALTANQINKHKGKRFICRYCCSSFQSEESLQKHGEYCSNHKAVKVKMPKKGTKLDFRNHQRRMRVPFVVYADFEALPEGISTCAPNGNESYTNQYQKHKPCGFCYYIKCFNDKLFPPVLRHYTITHKDESVGMAFVNSLEKDIRWIYQKFKNKKGLLITHEEEQEFQEATVCHICEELLHDDKVRDHCHLTGRYRGAAHSKCNLGFKLPDFYPVIFHNLSGYDTHMFIKDLAETPGKIDCISKTEEKYISFTKTIIVGAFAKNGKKIEVKRKIRFIDSLKFMASSLEKLVNNLDNYPNLQRHFVGDQLELVKRKGVYPYDYMNCFERLSETCLPPIECWYSRLNDSNISESDFKHANKVWDTFQMKTMEDYHDLYLQTDVLLLADVFERFRDICLFHYKLDPAWYFTAPGLAWDACLKMTQVELELLHDQDMLLMVEKGIRGGVSMISTRYGKANNKYMTKDRDGAEYDPSKPSTYIPYLDANNLYGWAMSRKLPTDWFKWMNPFQLENCFFHTCIVEVDLEYPTDLHDLHNDYPLAPDHLRMGRVEKLIPSLYRKENYVVHYEALKTYEKYGLKVTKIHRGIVFHDSPWMKPYIDFNTRLRMQSKNKFEKDFFKLMNNSVFGKTMEDIRKRTDIKLVTTPEQASKLINKPNYTHRTTFSDNLVAIHMAKTEIYMNKPVQIGMSILDISKTLMYDFYYGYLKPKYGEKIRLLFTDTDSLLFLIETEDFYKDISKDVHEWFDTSNYPQKDGSYLLHTSGIPTGENKMVIGMFKDEVGGKIITEFVGLRAKNYAYMCDGEEYKKCKGIKMNVTKKNISFKDYKDCLFKNVQLRRKMNVFRSRGHDVYSEEVCKVALSANDDKRVVLKDGVHTLAHGHYRNYMRD